MCLHLEHYNEQFIAQEDIICYKLMTFSLSSVYQHYRYSLGKKEIDKDFAKIIVDNSVDKNAFHSYDTVEITRLFTKSNNFITGFIVECVIPKGSRYYKGYHNRINMRGYASEQIIPKKIIGVSHNFFLEKYVKNYDNPIRGVVFIDPKIDPEIYDNCLRYDYKKCLESMIADKTYITMQEYIDYLNSKIEDTPCV